MTTNKIKTAVVGSVMQYRTAFRARFGRVCLNPFVTGSASQVSFEIDIQSINLFVSSLYMNDQAIKSFNTNEMYSIEVSTLPCKEF